MKAQSFMVVAGEPSGDLLASELIQALRQKLPATVQFFGAGGPKMAETGVALAFDLSQHAVVGLEEAIKKYRLFKRLFDQVVELAIQRRPDVILCIDFSGFNRRLVRKIRWEIQVRKVSDWRPRLVQYVSPQVWASRPGRARSLARDLDLLLAIFPFEKQWYAQRVPGLRVEFVGHPMLDRYQQRSLAPAAQRAGSPLPTPPEPGQRTNHPSGEVVLLPGSRKAELGRHLPVMLAAWEQIHHAQPDLQAVMVLPNEALAALARSFPLPAGLGIGVGRLAEALSQAQIAIASTGTVTLECAWFGVPTVAIYKTSWSTYQIGRRIIQVKFLAMPNLLANEALFPELIQADATGEKIAAAALELLRDETRRGQIRDRLGKVMESLGGPGANRRAAEAILRLV